MVFELFDRATATQHTTFTSDPPSTERVRSPVPTSTEPRRARGRAWRRWTPKQNQWASQLGWPAPLSRLASRLATSHPSSDTVTERLRGCRGATRSSQLDHRPPPYGIRCKLPTVLVALKYTYCILIMPRNSCESSVNVRGRGSPRRRATAAAHPLDTALLYLRAGRPCAPTCRQCSMSLPSNRLVA